jgi:hypothetical protein
MGATAFTLLLDVTIIMSSIVALSEIQPRLYASVTDAKWLIDACVLSLAADVVHSPSSPKVWLHQHFHPSPRAESNR